MGVWGGLGSKIGGGRRSNPQSPPSLPPTPRLFYYLTNSGAVFSGVSTKFDNVQLPFFLRKYRQTIYKKMVLVNFLSREFFSILPRIFWAENCLMPLSSFSTPVQGWWDLLPSTKNPDSFGQIGTRAGGITCKQCLFISKKCWFLIKNMLLHFLRYLEKKFFWGLKT